MPLVSVYTSAELPTDEKLSALQKALSSTAARLIGKPEAYVMTNVVARSRITLGGSFGPACLVEIKSIGGLGGDVPTRLTEAICKLLHEALGVPTNRIYVVFADIPANMWGFDGATFG